MRARARVGRAGVAGGAAALDRGGPVSAEAPFRILTPAQAAEILQVSARTVTDLCAQGRIPGATRVGRLWRSATGGSRAPSTTSSPCSRPSARTRATSRSRSPGSPSSRCRSAAAAA
ncbi:helix-turn-helix domain-containing protein [Sorangium sp. So ce1151]|uniref:helix-turn-helix domain-containing protein n=1 Tax=Sorangium sp. So ce1151 TaxID=3133332 RepID=UPI003F637B4D